MSDPELINCLHCGNEAKFISISGGTLWMACCLHVRLQHWGAPQNRKLQIRGTKYLKIIRNKSEDVMLISKKKFCEEIEKAKLERENRCFDRLFPKMKGVRMP